MQSVGEYSTSFYAFLFYSKLSYLTCTGVRRISPKQEGPNGMAAVEAMVYLSHLCFLTMLSVHQYCLLQLRQIIWAVA